MSARHRVRRVRSALRTEGRFRRNGRRTAEGITSGDLSTARFVKRSALYWRVSEAGSDAYWRSPDRAFDALADLQVGMLPGEVAS